MRVKKEGNVGEGGREGGRGRVDIVHAHIIIIKRVIETLNRSIWPPIVLQYHDMKDKLHVCK